MRVKLFRMIGKVFSGRGTAQAQALDTCGLRLQRVPQSVNLPKPAQRAKVASLANAEPNVLKNLTDEGFLVSNVKGALKAVKKTKNCKTVQYVNPQTGQVYKRTMNNSDFELLTQLEKDGTYTHILKSDEWFSAYKMTRRTELTYKGYGLNGVPTGAPRTIEIRQTQPGWSKTKVLNEADIQEGLNYGYWYNECVGEATKHMTINRSSSLTLPFSDSNAISFLKNPVAKLEATSFARGINVDNILHVTGRKYN